MYMKKSMFIDDLEFDMNKNTGAQDTIKTIFTPEDVEITETLYCLWITN